MTDIKELALRVADSFCDDEIPAGESWLSCFAQRFLAAYLAEQEPVAWLDLVKLKKGMAYATTFKATSQQTPLFAAPPEPAPQELSTPSQSLVNPRSVAPVGAASLSEDVNRRRKDMSCGVCDGIGCPYCGCYVRQHEPAPQQLKPQTTIGESADPAQPAAVGAAPLPEEVRYAVDRLRDSGWAVGMKDRRIAADMLKCMAEQVAALTHDVLTATEERDQKDKELAALTQERDNWQEDARCRAKNESFWQEKFAASQAREAKLRGALEIVSRDMQYVVKVEKGVRGTPRSESEYLYAIRQDLYQLGSTNTHSTTPLLEDAFKFKTQVAAEIAAVFVGGIVKDVM